MSAAVTSKEVREARAYLQGHGIRSSDMAPRHFAASAKELGLSFRDALNYLARLLSGGQGQGPAPQATKKVDILDPKNAIGGEPVDFAGETK